MSEETHISKKVDVPLYGGFIRIFVTKDMDKTLKEVDYDGDLECDACCLYYTNGTRIYDLIFSKEKVQHGLIAHECFHLTMRIMKGVNKPYDISNDEPEAYLIQYITVEVYKFLKEHKIKVK